MAAEAESHGPAMSGVRPRQPTVSVYLAVRLPPRIKHFLRSVPERALCFLVHKYNIYDESSLQPLDRRATSISAWMNATGASLGTSWPTLGSPRRS
jgi:hypothetical protein